jgi:hypothetical protein
LTFYSAIATAKKASIVIIGLPWVDERVARDGFNPQMVKEGIKTIGRLMYEHGFGDGYVNV